MIKEVICDGREEAVLLAKAFFPDNHPVLSWLESEGLDSDGEEAYRVQLYVLVGSPPHGAVIVHNYGKSGRAVALNSRLEPLAYYTWDAMKTKGQPFLPETIGLVGEAPAQLEGRALIAEAERGSSSVDNAPDTSTGHIAWQIPPEGMAQSEGTAGYPPIPKPLPPPPESPTGRAFPVRDDDVKGHGGPSWL